MTCIPYWEVYPKGRRCQNLLIPMLVEFINTELKFMSILNLLVTRSEFFNSNQRLQHTYYPHFQLGTRNNVSEFPLLYTFSFLPPLQVSKFPPLWRTKLLFPS